MPLFQIKFLLVFCQTAENMEQQFFILGDGQLPGMPQEEIGGHLKMIGNPDQGLIVGFTAALNVIAESGRGQWLLPAQQNWIPHGMRRRIRMWSRSSAIHRRCCGHTMKCSAGERGVRREFDRSDVLENILTSLAQKSMLLYIKLICM